MSRLGLGAVAALVLGAAPVVAQPADPSGDWSGTIAASPSMSFPLYIHLHRSKDGYTGEFDSPDQGAKGLALSGVTVKGDALDFDLPAAHAHYTAHWDAKASAWIGQWVQGPATPLNFARGDTYKAAIPELDGYWSGTLSTPEGLGALIVRLRTGSVSSVTTPGAGAPTLPITDIVRDADHVTFNAGGLSSFDGRLSADGKTLDGQWRRGGPLGAVPLHLTWTAEPPKPNRPQTPRPPFPYRSVEVGYDNPKEPVHLAGTLTLPQGKGPFPVALLITGSGLQDRDETVYDHKPFLVLADDLTRRGIAVLRVDDRTVGGSTGDVAKATSADFATDVEAGVRFLKTRPEIDPRRIGLIGHSEGGMIAPMVAAADPSVAFVVMLAGPGLKGDRMMELQFAALTKAEGGSPEAVAASAAQERAALQRLEAEPAGTQAPGAGLSAGDPMAQAKRDAAHSPWFRYLISYDPAPTLARLRCPVLALGGTLDSQVPVAENTPALKAALAHDPDATVLELPGLNHAFQTARSGAPMEHYAIEETLSPVALKTVGDWVVAHTR